MPSDEILERIEAKLDLIVRLEAMRSAMGLKQTQAILLLADAGFDRRLIAELLHTTPNTVSVTLSTSKSKRKGKGKAD